IAHGVLAWALASILAAMVLGSGAVALVGSAARLAMNSSGTTTQSSAIANPRAYLTDSLFRADHVVTVAPDTRDVAGRILSMAIANNGLSDSDKSYLSQIVATTTGLAPADASKRVENVMTETKRQADEARKAGSLL